MLDARNGLTGSDLRRPPPELQLHTQPVRSRTHLRQSIYGAQPKVCQTAKQLKDKGHVTRGWIGVQIQPVTPTIAEAIGLKTPEGALVAQLEPNSPAAKAGIETGDVITSVNGEVVKDSRISPGRSPP
jgi:predicted metalloprotease with PDZ domain